ncbi:MAG: hypothetical protein AAGG51_03635 [Cyanobacteria bacterium P01_G01_bin.54]
MNAAEQANSIDRVSKIASIVNLFKSRFPDVTADLSPWLNNPETQQFDDAHSIDLAFHFSRRHFTCQCSCILMQVRLPASADNPAESTATVELSGHEILGQQWQFSTVGKLEFRGIILPYPDAERKLREIAFKTLKLFNLKIQKSGASD